MTLWHALFNNLLGWIGVSIKTTQQFKQVKKRGRVEDNT